MENLVERINQKYKHIIIRKGNEAVALNIPRISTEIFELDKALGGGFPFSKIHLIYGPPASLKTTLLLKIAASAQKYCRYCLKPFFLKNNGQYICKDCKKSEGMKIFWIDSEHSFDNSWATKIGVNLDNLWVAQPEYAEEAIDIGKMALYDGDIDVLVLDSIASLTPTVEIEKDAGDQIYSPGAKIMNRALRIWNSAILSYGMDTLKRPTIFLINQIRTDVTKIWGSKEKLPYGEAQNFVCSTKLRMNSIPESKYIKKDSSEVTYIEGSFKVMKNKSYVPYQEGSFRLFVRPTDIHRVGDTDDYERVFKYARDFDVIRKVGSKYLYNDKEYDRLEDLKYDFVKYDKFRKIRENVLKEIIGESRNKQN